MPSSSHTESVAWHSHPPEIGPVPLRAIWVLGHS